MDPRLRNNGCHAKSGCECSALAQGLADVTQNLEAVQQLEPPSKGRAEAVEQGTGDAGGQHTSQEAEQRGQEGAQQDAQQGIDADVEQQQEAQREVQQQQQAQLEAQRQQKQQQAESDRQRKQQHAAELEAVQKQQQQLQAQREEQLQQQQASSYQIEGVKNGQSQDSSAGALSEEEALGTGAAGDAQTDEPGAAQNPQSQQQQKSATHYDSIDPMESRREWSGATLCAIFTGHWIGSFFDTC